MILTIDIGNSNICFGVYEGKNALFTARAKTIARQATKNTPRRSLRNLPLH